MTSHRLLPRVHLQIEDMGEGLLTLATRLRAVPNVL